MRIRGFGALIALAAIGFSATPPDFKTEQLRYPRVRQAYADTESEVNTSLRAHGLEKQGLRLYFRAFKAEKQLELWAKSGTQATFQRVKTYQICRTSGGLGPKRKQGDKQIPEGFYHINRFNAQSDYYLSLGLNYPNASDKILSDSRRPGDNIFIHGDCVTIGCLPMTDRLIKEIYVWCVEARQAGQNTIPITIFPMKMTQANMQKLEGESGYAQHAGLWQDLRDGYVSFLQSQKLPTIAFLENGRHRVRASE